MQSYHQGTRKPCWTPKWGSQPPTDSYKPPRQAAVHCSHTSFSLDNWLCGEPCKICRIILNLPKTTYLPTCWEKKTWKTIMAFPGHKYQRWGWQQRCLLQLSGTSPFPEPLSTVKKRTLLLNAILGISIKMMHMLLKIKPKKSTFHCPS